MMIFQFHPPMALATLAAVQTVTDSVFETNAKPQLCSISSVYRGANQRMSWNALSEKASAEGRLLETGGKPSTILPLTTIDKLVSDLGLKRVDVIKMDIKGATAKAIQGARAVIKRDKPMIALATEEGDDVDNPHALTESLLELHAEYESKCGDCSLVEGRPRPNLLTFR